jgi:hypothetical protein
MVSGWAFGEEVAIGAREQMRGFCGSCGNDEPMEPASSVFDHESESRVPTF